MKKTVAGSIAIMVGLAFIVTTIVANLFAVGPAFERMTDNFRPYMTAESIASYQRGVAGLDAVNQEFTTKVAPTIAGALGMTPAQFNAFVGQNYPAVSAGVKSLPAITTTFNGVLGTLAGERVRFASADGIPTTSLPATTVPWAIFFAGILALIVGLRILVGGKTTMVVAGLLAVVLIVAPLALFLTTKASNADQMNANLKPVYTAQLVAGAKSSIATIQAMGSEMQTKMLPALAQAMHMTPAQLGTYIGANFPAMAGALQTLPAQVTAFNSLVGAFDRSLADYNTLKPVTLLPIVWLLIGGGIVMLFASFLGASGIRRTVVHLRQVPAKAA